MNWTRDEEIKIIYDSRESSLYNISESDAEICSEDDEVEIIFDSNESTPEHPRDSQSPFYWSNEEYNYSNLFQLLLEMRPGIKVDVPAHVQRKHFMGTPSIQQAEQVSLEREEEKLTKNTVFQSTQKLYKGVIKRKSHNLLFQSECTLYISGRPLKCYETTWHQDGTLTTKYVGLRYAIFSGDCYQEMHFLKDSKKMKPKNCFFTRPTVDVNVTFH